MDAAHVQEHAETTREAWSEQFARTLAAHRQRARELLRTERERLEEYEQTVSAQVSALQEGRGDEQLASAGSESLAELLAQLETRWQEITAQEAELARRRAQWDAQQDETARQYMQLLGELQQQMQHIEQQRSALDERRAELDRRELQLHELQEQQEQLGSAAPSVPASSDELEQLKQERDQLARELEQAQEELAQQREEADSADLQQRLQMAMEEIRDLKRRNHELASKAPTASKSAPPAASTGSSQKLDWESQKKRLLAQLEADGDAPALSNDDRMTVEGTISITDAIVADKEREIERLKRLLEERNRTPDPEALNAVVDRDALVQQEREKLRQMQEDWRDKLRQAEVEISIERAKLARERTELEEKLQHYQSLLARGDVDPQEIEGRKAAKGGRWLTRLGLKEDT